MKQSDNTFKHYWIDEQQGLGNSHGGQYMPPWIMNRNRYVVDDFGTVVKYLPYKVSLCWACIDSTGQVVTEWTARQAMTVNQAKNVNANDESFALAA